MVYSGKIISKYFLCYNKFICNLKLKLQRNSFVSIEQKNHPNVAISVFDFEESIASPDSIDFSIAEEIVSEVLRQESSSLNSGTGEWSWLQDHRQKNILVFWKGRMFLAWLIVWQGCSGTMRLMGIYLLLFWMYLKIVS